MDTFVRKFASYIAESGIRVSIVADGLTYQQISIGEGSLKFVPLKMERNPSPFKDLRSLVGLIKVMQSDRPDILIYATPKASLLAAFSGLLLRVPKRIYQIWGLRLETTQGIVRQILMAMEKTTSFCSTKILANSSSLKSIYCEMGLNLRTPVDVVGEGSSHGVDLEYYSNEADIGELPLELQRFASREVEVLKVGFVGRLHPDKGIDTLIKAAKLIQKTGVQIAFVLVGKDEGAEIHELKLLGFDFLQLGHITDVRPYYSAIDVLVLPSLREGFPNVVLEAAAMGVPAIVSNGTGVIDSVLDGKTGLITPVRDEEKLAEAILKLNDDRVLLGKLGENARMYVEKNYEQQEVWEKNLSYYLN